MAKFERKCAECGRSANSKHRGVNFCERCLKYFRRQRKAKGIYGEKHILTIPGTNVKIYKSIVIPFK